MGAKPLSVQDVIICGKLEKDKVMRIVSTIADACRDQGCVLTGGEISEQPGVTEEEKYILTFSIVGIVDKGKIIDGSRIEPEDVVIAVESSGLHTNGYSRVRELIKGRPGILDRDIEGRTFLDCILEPHRCCYTTILGFPPPEAIQELRSQFGA